MSLQGNIEEMGLGEVIQALSLNRHKGTLRIETDEGGSKFFALSEGEIVLIRTVRSEPVKIGELLLRAGKVTQAQLGEALELQKATGQRLGEALVALGACAGADVDQVVRDKFEQEFLDVFLLDRGRFEFVFGLLPEMLFSPEEKLERIALDTRGLMLEAMRRVDEWQALLKDLGSLDSIWVNREAEQHHAVESYSFPGVALAPELKRELYEALDGTRTIRDVLGYALVRGTPRVAAFAFVHALWKENLIRALEAAECLEAAKRAVEAEDAPGSARFLRAVLTRGNVDRQMVEKYVEFLRRSSKPGLARAECKQLAAGYLAHGEIDNAIALWREALGIEPNDTEVLDRLFYCHLRKGDVPAALDLGTRFREFLSRDTDVPVAARVLKNMQDLAPDDWRVVELAGLLHRRQERKREAKDELERALDLARAASAPEERLVAILDVLVEIDPERASHARERERLRRQAIVAQEQISARRRFRGLVAALLLVVLALLGREQLLAQREVAQAEKEFDTATDAMTRLHALELFRAASQRVSTLRWRARESAEKAESLVRSDIEKLAAGADEAFAEKRRREEAARAARDAADRERLIQDALADVAAARDALDLEKATRLANELHERFHDDPRVAALTVPVRVRSSPAGRARIGDGPERPTPCILDAPPRAKVSVRVRRPGCAPVVVQADTSGKCELDVRLELGPAWKVKLEGPLAGDVALGSAGARGEVAVARLASGGVVALSADDGTRLWAADAAALDPGEGPGSTVAAGVAAGRAVVPLRGGALAVLDLATGEVQGRIEGTSAVTASPLPVELVTGERLLVLRGASLEVVDPAARKVERTVALPAAGSLAPAVSGHTAALALAGGRLVLADLERGVLLWNAPLEGELAGPPAVSLDLRVVVVATRDGRLAAYGLESGNLAYRTGTELSAFASGPVCGGTWLYVATPTGLAALDARDGRSLWVKTYGPTSGGGLAWIGPELALPLASGEAVLVATRDGARRGAEALDGPARGQPRVSGGRAILAGGTTVLALEKPEEE